MRPNKKRNKYGTLKISSSKSVPVTVRYDKLAQLKNIDTGFCFNENDGDNDKRSK